MANNLENLQCFEGFYVGAQDPYIPTADPLPATPESADNMLAGLDGQTLAASPIWEAYPIGDPPTLQHAVLMSLFSDRRAEPDDEVPDNTGDRRGWWPDAIQNDLFGSRLWLLDRAVVTDSTPALVEQYMREALQWMLDDGIATAIETEAERQDKDRVAASVTVRRDETLPDIELNFEDIWDPFREGS